MSFDKSSYMKHSVDCNWVHPHCTPEWFLFMPFSPAGYPRARFPLFSNWSMGSKPRVPRDSFRQETWETLQAFEPLFRVTSLIPEEGLPGCQNVLLWWKTKPVYSVSFISPRVFRHSVIRKVLHPITVILWKIRRVLFCCLLAMQIGSIVFLNTLSSMIEGDLNTFLALFSQLFPEEFANPNCDACVMSIYYYCYFRIIF